MKTSKGRLPACAPPAWASEKYSLTWGAAQRISKLEQDRMHPAGFEPGRKRPAWTQQPILYLEPKWLRWTLRKRMRRPTLRSCRFFAVSQVSAKRGRARARVSIGNSEQTAPADGHTVSNAPDLFRPPKLSGTGPG